MAIEIQKFSVSNTANFVTFTLEMRSHRAITKIKLSLMFAVDIIANIVVTCIRILIRNRSLWMDPYICRSIDEDAYI